MILRLMMVYVVWCKVCECECMVGGFRFRVSGPGGGTRDFATEEIILKLRYNVCM